MMRQRAEVSKEEVETTSREGAKFTRTCGGATTKEEDGCQQLRSISQKGIDGLWKERAAQWRRKSWRSTRWTTPKRVLINDVVSRQIGGSSRKKKRN